jgi:hypothetical protein
MRNSRIPAYLHMRNSRIPAYLQDIIDMSEIDGVKPENTGEVFAKLVREAAEDRTQDA